MIVKKGSVPFIKGDKSAIEPLIKVLKDKNGDVRASTAMALGTIGDKSAIKPLIEVLKDKKEFARLEAERALKKITGQDFGTDYEQWMEWWEKNK